MGSWLEIEVMSQEVTPAAQFVKRMSGAKRCSELSTADGWSTDMLGRFNTREMLKKDAAESQTAYGGG